MKNFLAMSRINVELQFNISETVSAFIVRVNIYAGDAGRYSHQNNGQ
jgi:hypothetical protein